MIITDEFLKTEIESLQQQAEVAQQTFIAAKGAIQAYEALREYLKKPEEAITLKELGDMVGGTAEEPEPLNA